MNPYANAYPNGLSAFSAAQRESKKSLALRAVEETRALCASWQSDATMSADRRDLNVRSAVSDLNAVLIRVFDDIKSAFGTNEIARRGFGGGLQKAWSE